MEGVGELGAETGEGTLGVDGKPGVGARAPAGAGVGTLGVGAATGPPGAGVSLPAD